MTELPPTVGAVLPKSRAESATLALEQAGLAGHELVNALEREEESVTAPPGWGHVETGPHEVLLVVEVEGRPDEAAQILRTHGGQMVEAVHPDRH